MLRNLGGDILAVSDRQILSAQRLLAEEEGMFCLPASAAALAGVLELSGQGRLPSGGPVVLVLTGTGLKNIRAFPVAPGNVFSSSLQDLEDLIDELTG
jgi:threonine synthase